MDPESDENLPFPNSGKPAFSKISCTFLISKGQSATSEYESKRYDQDPEMLLMKHGSNQRPYTGNSTAETPKRHAPFHSGISPFPLGRLVFLGLLGVPKGLVLVFLAWFFGGLLWQQRGGKNFWAAQRSLK